MARSVFFVRMCIQNVNATSIMVEKIRACLGTYARTMDLLVTFYRGWDLLNRVKDGRRVLVSLAAFFGCSCFGGGLTVRFVLPWTPPCSPCPSMLQQCPCFMLARSLAQHAWMLWEMYDSVMTLRFRADADADERTRSMFRIIIVMAVCHGGT